MTVGVPVTVQPGTVTELYPDNDGSPSSAPGLTSRFGPSTGGAATCWVLASGAKPCRVCSISRRTNANSVHSAGSSIGASGLAVIEGPNPAHPSRVDRTLVTTCNGANGPLNRGGSTCGVIVTVGLAAKVIDAGAVAGAATVSVRTA